jgi:hypothetical protein
LRASKLTPEDWAKVDQGLRLPFLEDLEPDIDEGLMFYWLAWNVLHPGRQRSMGGPSGLTLVELRAFMDEYDVAGRDDRDRFIHLVQRMDAKYREHVNEEMQRSSEGVKSG